MDDAFLENRETALRVKGFQSCARNTPATKEVRTRDEAALLRHPALFCFYPNINPEACLMSV
jgi:hypothetical protein